MIELTGLKKVRERINDKNNGLRDANPLLEEWIKLNHELAGLEFAQEQFQSDLRATITRLKEIEERLNDIEALKDGGVASAFELTRDLIKSIENALEETS